MESVARIVLPALLLLAGPAALAFEASWTDQFGETTYAMAGPDSAAVGDSILVALRVTDPLYPDAWIAGPWQFLLDSTMVDGGTAIWLTDGVWACSYPFVFAEAGSHVFTFRAQDHGHGGGAHNWQWGEVSGTTSIVEPPTPAEPTTWGRIKAAMRDR
jgi:hypothetical protein